MSSLQASIDWPTAATIVAVMAPLVAIPLSVVVFYLKSMHEHQATRQNDLLRRMETLEESAATTRQRLVETQRDYTTKEEWLRESMATRRNVERLLASVTRLETEIDVVRGWSRYIESRLRAAGAAETPEGVDRVAAKPDRSEQC